VWKTGSTVLGTGETTSFTLPVGENTISLTVEDSGGNTSTETISVIVYSGEFPAISSLSPDSGPVAGGNDVTISGSGFTALASQTIVSFGQSKLTGAAIKIVDQNTITVKAPAANTGVPVAVSVETTVGKSNTKEYVYVASTPIEFSEKKLVSFDTPTVVRFGPNGTLLNPFSILNDMIQCSQFTHCFWFRQALRGKYHGSNRCVHV